MRQPLRFEMYRRTMIRSNVETGEGYSGISVCTPQRMGIVIELKYAHDGNLEAACEKVLKQIGEKSMPWVCSARA